MKDYRHRIKGLPDLLNYALMVEEGICLLKDGGFCAGWQYVGPDMHSIGEEDWAVLRCGINQTLCQLGDGWMLHADLIRQRISDYPDSTANHFPDPLSRWLDQERRQYFESANLYDSKMTFILTFKPPADVETRFAHFFIQEDTSHLIAKAKKTAGWEQVLRFFTSKIEQLDNSLSKYLTVGRLTTTQLLSHVHQCLTGKNFTLSHPYFAVYLDQLLGSQDFVGGFAPRIGEQHIRMLGINGFPLASHPGMLQHLSDLPMAFRWSNRFIFLDPTTASTQLKKYRRYWFQKRQGLLGMVKEVFNAQESSFLDQDALEMADDADKALQEAESNLVRFGYYTSNFVLLEQNLSLLDASSKLLTKQLENQGFSTRVETVNAVEAFLGSLPGHGYQNVRKPLLYTLNLADLLPLASLWPGHKQQPCPYYPPNSPPLLYAQTQGQTPFRCNLHVGDVGHTLVLGDTGSGKSTLLGWLMAQQLRYPNAQVFLFDKGYSSFALCQALGGRHYDLGAEQTAAHVSQVSVQLESNREQSQRPDACSYFPTSLSFAPLQSIHRDSELDWACTWLEGVFESQNITLQPHHRSEIRESLLRLAQQPSRTLSDLQASLQLEDLKHALEYYTLSGAMGNLLDSDTDSLADSHLQVFEMEAILNQPEKFMLPLLSYLFHKINQRLDRSKPTLIILEEGHRFLTGRFGQQLEVWLRECRKHNAAIVLVTQGLSEIVNSPYKHILLNSCPTKIFLANPHANAAYNRALYQEIGLTTAQIDRIAQAIPKQDYYYTSPEGNRLMDLALSPTFLALMRHTSLAERNRIQQLQQTHGSAWVVPWFREKGLPQVADVLAKSSCHQVLSQEK